MSDSRFNNTEKIIFNGVETYGIWSPPSFIRERPAPSEIGTFRVTSGLEGRPDKIADELYGVSRLDWVLIAFNNARTLNWPAAGEVIEYPVESIVFPELI